MTRPHRCYTMLTDWEYVMATHMAEVDHRSLSNLLSGAVVDMIRRRIVYDQGLQEASTAYYDRRAEWDRHRWQAE